MQTGNQRANRFVLEVGQLYGDSVHMSILRNVAAASFSIVRVRRGFIAGSIVKKAEDMGGFLNGVGSKDGEAVATFIFGD